MEQHISFSAVGWIKLYERVTPSRYAKNSYNYKEIGQYVRVSVYVAESWRLMLTLAADFNSFFSRLVILVAAADFCHLRG